MANSLVYSNTVSHPLGAGICRSSGAFTVTHTTLANNVGGSGSCGVASAAFNTIAWGNDGFPGFSVAPVVAACDIDDGGTAGLEEDPQFVAPAWERTTTCGGLASPRRLRRRDAGGPGRGRASLWQSLRYRCLRVFPRLDLRLLAAGGAESLDSQHPHSDAGTPQTPSRPDSVGLGLSPLGGEGCRTPPSGGRRIWSPSAGLSARGREMGGGPGDV